MSPEFWAFLGVSILFCIVVGIQFAYMFYQISECRKELRDSRNTLRNMLYGNDADYRCRGTARRRSRRRPMCFPLDEIQETK